MECVCSYVLPCRELTVKQFLAVSLYVQVENRNDRRNTTFRSRPAERVTKCASLPKTVDVPSRNFHVLSVNNGIPQQTTTSINWHAQSARRSKHHQCLALESISVLPLQVAKTLTYPLRPNTINIQHTTEERGNPIWRCCTD